MEALVSYKIIYSSGLAKSTTAMTVIRLPQLRSPRTDNRRRYRSGRSICFQLSLPKNNPAACFRRLLPRRRCFTSPASIEYVT